MQALPFNFGDKRNSVLASAYQQMLSLHLGVLLIFVDTPQVDCCIFLFVNAALCGKCRFLQYGPSISP